MATINPARFARSSLSRVANISLLLFPIQVIIELGRYFPFLIRIWSPSVNNSAPSRSTDWIILTQSIRQLNPHRHHFLSLEIHPHYPQLGQWHINQVRKILKLYNAVRKASSEDLIYEIVEVKMHKGMFSDLTEDREVTDRYFVHWTDGELIQILPEHFEEKPILEIAQYTLAKILESRISNGINIGVEDIISNPSTKGFMITEQRYTRYLLAAIYYDLWQNINDFKNVYICANKSCRLPFIKSGRKKYCDEACKQEAYRIRLAEKEGDE